MTGFDIGLRDILALAGVIVISACSNSTEVATSSPSADSKAPAASPTIAASPSPDPSPSPAPSPSPFVFPSPTPLPVGTPVTRQVLAPAKVLPLAALCSYKLLTTADGNYRPLFCRSGAINVLAWRGYIPISSNVMSLGRSTTLSAIKTAMCQDAKFLHATKPEEEYAYDLSTAYYGWRFGTAPITWLYGPYDPNHPLC